ncbi:hypothetical protein [Oryza sativa Japonica Group]|uniref:KIB1-4 beta-propeller domain-containing protein n=1 Tax=Oryza sativa subsp. japonica TaxID=39947 RepID=Q5JKL2_ORYSJ|nr:hypothetical protein DAI22_01g467800 [Oryza sativa Japonica Group]BAD87996.1 hypothetical protein [Oryza sativa Japonica Group]
MAPPVCFSDLPPEALDDIARRAGALNNVVCSAVCRPWRRALKTTRLGLLKQPNRPYSVNLELWCGSIELHPIRRCINGERTVRIANHDGAAPVTRIVGSSHGWLVTVDEDGGLSLLEAVTGRLYPLPPITSSGSKKVAKDLDQMGESMFQKAELVPGHRLGTFAVMLIHGGGFGMSFLRPGAKCWTAVRVPKWMKQKFVDVVFHQGAFYTECAWVSLVVSIGGGDLLMVSRLHEREGAWLAVEDLGEAAILVGSSCSLSVSTRGSRDALRNHLYFARPPYRLLAADGVGGIWLPTEFRCNQAPFSLA